MFFQFSMFYSFFFVVSVEKWYKVLRNWVCLPWKLTNFFAFDLTWTMQVQFNFEIDLLPGFNFFTSMIRLFMISCSFAFEHPERLYFGFLATKPPKKTGSKRYISISSESLYRSFAHDFGPPNLAVLYKFCRRIDRHLVSESEHICSFSESQSLCFSRFHPCFFKTETFFSVPILKQVFYISIV